MNSFLLLLHRLLQPLFEPGGMNGMPCVYFNASQGTGGALLYPPVRINMVEY